MGERDKMINILLDEADRELGLYELLPKHADVYGYPPDPVTGEKALACLLSLGDAALDQAMLAEEQIEQLAAYQQAALAYKYAYLLRNASIAPDPDLVDDTNGVAFAKVVEEQVFRLLPFGSAPALGDKPQ